MPIYFFQQKKQKLVMCINKHIITCAFTKQMTTTTATTTTNNTAARTQPLTFRARQAQMLAIASAHTHRVCASVEFQSDPENSSLLVCPVATMGALVQQVRAQFDLSLRRRGSALGRHQHHDQRPAPRRWSITVYDDQTGARLNSSSFKLLLSSRTGWALTHVTVRVAES
jgi:hypothetical protein